jgi:transcriptional regulator with XRE-family HTH domain
MHAVRAVELEPVRSPLAIARLRRQLSVEEAAGRAGLTPDEVSWLEEGRVYRFRSPDAALAATLLLVAALEVDRREALELTGLPVPPRRPERNVRGRVAAIAALIGALAALLLVPRFGGDEAGAPAAAPVPKLPPPWRVSVVVLNGGGDINHTRRVASRIGALAYQVKRVARADRFDYRQTTVYYAPEGGPIAARLARQLGVGTKPLPGGNKPRRLIVIVGPRRGPG